MRGTSIGLAGFSQGGWIGPMAATRSPDVAFMVFFSGPVTTVCEEGHFSDLAERDPTFWKTHTRQEVAEYMKSISCPRDDVDPGPTLSRLRVPGFWAFGGQDNVMPVDLSVTRLDALISRGQSQFRYRIYFEYGHEVIVFDFSRLSLSTGFREAVEWIKQTVGEAAQHGAASE
jgi:pimeloyl-ACP methyl ester carboxylesterase